MLLQESRPRILSPNSMSLLPNSLGSLALRLAFAAALIGSLGLPDQGQEGLPTSPQSAAADADATSLAETEDQSQPFASIVRSRTGFSLGLPERASGKDAAVAARHKCVSPVASVCREHNRTAGFGSCSRPARTSLLHLGGLADGDVRSAMPRFCPTGHCLAASVRIYVRAASFRPAT